MTDHGNNSGRASASTGGTETCFVGVSAKFGLGGWILHGPLELRFPVSGVFLLPAPPSRGASCKPRGSCPIKTPWLGLIVGSSGLRLGQGACDKSGGRLRFFI